jgi:co-chaperonin GroES (HSP10)
MNPKKEQRQVIKLDSIEGYHPYSGAVLVRPVSKENITTKSGIILGINISTQYGEGTESHVADFTSTEGTVIALPLHQETEGYEIPNELIVGDHVWWSYRGTTLGVEIIVGKELYLLVEYFYMMAAKRDEEIIILNGFVLVEEIQQRRSDVIETITGIDKTRGIVRYMGQKRTYPDGSGFTDEIDIEIGDEVLIRKGSADIKTERQKYLSTFSDIPYRRLRRRDIIAVINSFEVES